MDGADAQVPTEECHRWVLALVTLAGHVAVRGKLGAKRVATYPFQPLAPDGLQLHTAPPRGDPRNSHRERTPYFEPPFCLSALCCCLLSAHFLI